MDLSTHFCHCSRCTAGIEDVQSLFTRFTAVSSRLNGYFRRQHNTSFWWFFFFTEISFKVLTLNIFTSSLRWSPVSSQNNLLAHLMFSYSHTHSATLHFCHGHWADVQSARELWIIPYVLYYGTHVHAHMHLHLFFFFFQLQRPTGVTFTASSVGRQKLRMRGQVACSSTTLVITSQRTERVDHRSASARCGLNVNTWTDDEGDDGDDGTDCCCLSCKCSILSISVQFLGRVWKWGRWQSEWMRVDKGG